MKKMNRTNPRRSDGRIIVGIDASRNRSGGARGHLIGILGEGNPQKYGIHEIHIWAYCKLNEAIPDREWLIKHNPFELEKSIFHQVWWQWIKFPKEAKMAGCSIVLNTDAGSVSSFHPSITMSRDMLSFEAGELNRFGIGMAWLRLILLRYIQCRSLRNADGAIFLTRYASNVIQSFCGRLSRAVIINHGVGNEFKNTSARNKWPDTGERSIKCLYISPVSEFKHQWVVVRAIEILRSRGHNVVLSLIGGINRRSSRLIQRQIIISDPDRNFVNLYDFLPHKDLPGHISDSDLFIFASSCENMPNTLVEAMAVGLPIACSERGPMPEILQNGGVYFDPECAESIAGAMEQLINNKTMRERVARRAKELSGHYSWKRCADETFSFISETHRRFYI